MRPGRTSFLSFMGGEVIVRRIHNANDQNENSSSRSLNRTTTTRQSSTTSFGNKSSCCSSGVGSAGCGGGCVGGATPSTGCSDDHSSNITIIQETILCQYAV
mmetsp:Transcript_11105/g.10765  ORF Transcript_11105/g.10765 Transcript_11105/m.10765 type:complete len:102 (-) Transcript_11105:31-336(-)